MLRFCSQPATRNPLWYRLHGLNSFCLRIMVFLKVRSGGSSSSWTTVVTMVEQSTEKSMGIMPRSPMGFGLYLYHVRFWIADLWTWGWMVLGEPEVDFQLLKNQIFKILPTYGEAVVTQLYLTFFNKGIAWIQMKSLFSWGLHSDLSCSV